MSRQTHERTMTSRTAAVRCSSSLNLSTVDPQRTLVQQSAKRLPRNKGRPAKRWEDDLNTNLQPDRTNRDNNDLMSDMTWLTTAEGTSTWDAMDSDFINIRLKQPARPKTSTNTTTITQPTTHEQTTHTTTICAKMITEMRGADLIVFELIKTVKFVI